MSHAVSLASEMTGVDPGLIRGRSRKDQVVAARWIAWGIIVGEGFGYKPTAKAWGCDHTTIINAKSKGWGMEKAAPDEEGGHVLHG